MKLHHIALIASERDRTVAFYEALGFSIVSEHVRPDRGDTILMMERDGIVLEIFVKENCPARPSYPEAYGLRHLALQVEDVEAFAAKLAALGYRPEPIRRDSFTGEKMTFVPDPDGLPIELHE